MKKLALTLAGVAALAAAPTVASAQVTGVINATATIETVLAFGSSQAADFGAIVPGSGSTASGWIQLSRNVGVVFTLPDAGTTGQLTGPSGTISPTYTCGVGATSSAVTDAFSSCAPATGTTGVLTLAAPAGAPVTEYVIFNGSIAAAQTGSLQPGTYNGTIRITATAN